MPVTLLTWQIMQLESLERSRRGFKHRSALKQGAAGVSCCSPLQRLQRRDEEAQNAYISHHANVDYHVKVITFHHISFRPITHTCSFPFISHEPRSYPTLHLTRVTRHSLLHQLRIHLLPPRHQLPHESLIPLHILLMIPLLIMFRNQAILIQV